MPYYYKLIMSVHIKHKLLHHAKRIVLHYNKRIVHSGRAGDDFEHESMLPATRTRTLDQLYLAVGQALDNLIRAIGLEVAA
jgi:hypothetical protein